MAKAKYSFLSLFRHGLQGHKNWPQAWRSPDPKPHYDVVIIGAGGHGLATAYYLAKNHGVTNVAVIEKGWLGGGNTGRNTTIIRSNYLQDASTAIFEKARSLYEDLSQQLNFNIMFSPRGVLMLAQTEHELRAWKRTAHANRLAGITSEMVGPERVKEICPIIEVGGPRYPVLGALWQARGGTARHDAVNWGYARAADKLGVDIIQNCEVTDFIHENGAVVGVNTSRGEVVDVLAVTEALKSMKYPDTRTLIVDKRNEDDEYGVVMFRDMAKKVLSRDQSPDRVNIYEIMSKPVIAVDPDMDIRYCSRLFDRFGLSRAPVLENHQIIGLVSYSDIVLKGLNVEME